MTATMSRSFTNTGNYAKNCAVSLKNTQQQQKISHITTAAGGQKPEFSKIPKAKTKEFFRVLVIWRNWRATYSLWLFQVTYPSFETLRLFYTLRSDRVANKRTRETPRWREIPTMKFVRVEWNRITEDRKNWRFIAVLRPASALTMSDETEHLNILGVFPKT